MVEVAPLLHVAPRPRSQSGFTNRTARMPLIMEPTKPFEENGEDICISGMAGVFPGSDNVQQFKENLFNKFDPMVDNTAHLSNPEIPRCSAQVNNKDKFDSTFFKVHHKQADTMDPMGRMLLERTFEAIYDAGVNPTSLRNSKTGVFVGVSTSETEVISLQTSSMELTHYTLTGCNRSLLANRISYWIGCTGPSCIIDSACSSAMYALNEAFKSINNGDCDAAIVGACHLCLLSLISIQFKRLGVLSADGRCRPFDKDGTGYSRAEAISVIFLQRFKDCKRVYSRLVYVNSNNDGFKTEGMTFPLKEGQISLYKDLYQRANVNPGDLEYIEAHGTSTLVGDPQEISSIDEFFCKDRKCPLLIGSVKSNVGHSEPASGITSLIKMCIAYDTGFIPPTIHYKEPKKELTAIIEGRIQVVANKMAWNRGLVGINSFGFGGSNSHVLMAPFNKKKVNNGLPKDNLPRLICVSSRTESGLNKFFDDAESRPVDEDYIALIHSLHEADIAGHIYRGYALLGPDGKSKTPTRSVTHYGRTSRPLWFVFSGMGSQWLGAGVDLMKLPTFAAAIEKCHNVLMGKGLNLKWIITDKDPKIMENILYTFVAITSIQIGLCDVLKTLGLFPDNVIGHSMGEIGCSYADGSLTLEQAILCAYYRGVISVEIPYIKGSMAAVGLPYSAIKTMCPPDIEVACHNGPDSSTISGPADSVKEFVKHLNNHGIFVKEVPCGNIAYHSKYVAEAGVRLMEYLSEVIPKPKKRSAKWLCTSLLMNEWETEKAQYSSAEYHTNNLLNPVYFEETSRLVPSNAILIEIAPHGLLQAILNRSLKKNCINIPLTNRHSEDNLLYFLAAVGKLFEAGLNPKVSNLYPHVQFPVPNATPHLSHLVEWDHSDTWKVPENVGSTMESCERDVHIHISDPNYQFLTGHNVDGRNLYPATGYIFLVWETFGMMMKKLPEDFSVAFENVRFLRATNIPTNEKLTFTITISRDTGHFEVVENQITVVMGKIKHLTDTSKEFRTLQEPEDTGEWKLTSKDIYKEMRLRGYRYTGLFRGLASSNLEGTNGTVAWKNSFWIPFMDSVLQYNLLRFDSRGLYVPTRLRRFVIDPRRHFTSMERIMEDEKKIPIVCYKDLDLIICGGIAVRGLHATEINRRYPLGIPVLEKYVFAPHYQENATSIEDVLRINVQLLIENANIFNVRALEFFDPPKNSKSQPLMPIIRDILGDMPLIHTDLVIVTDLDVESEANITTCKELKIETSDYSVIVGSDFLQRPKDLSKMIEVLKDKGIVISREKPSAKIEEFYESVDVITAIRVGDEKFVVFMKNTVPCKKIFVHVREDDDRFEFIDEIKSTVKKIIEEGKNGKLILVVQNEATNGILGFVNCLKREIGTDIIKCFFIVDPEAPTFNPDLPFYQTQLDKDLSINIYKNGSWGSYRHLLLEPFKEKIVEQYYYNIEQRGDLSTLRWYENNINTEELCADVYYSALNYRDVVTAAGRISLDLFTENRLDAQCVQGLEYSGKLANGVRIMGVAPNKAIANVVKVAKGLVWPVPEHWSLEDAATVPIAYLTVICALRIEHQLKPGCSILIHGGMGGVGQACINYCLHYGCEIFTTVGTDEKRKSLRKLFPQIKDDHIASTRDLLFEDMIYSQTKGKGVDIVINSLTDDKLMASLRCMATYGKFIEIGKYDIINDTEVGMYIFRKGITMTSLMSPMNLKSEEQKLLREYMIEGIISGAVKPLCRNVFSIQDTDKSFRFMAASKHQGKVLLNIRKEETGEYIHLIKLLPSFQCNGTVSYVVVGGLGGFGLEMIDWMILKGVRNVVINSRNGIKNGYQAYRIKIWKSYGVKIVINTNDVSTNDGCTKLLNDANNLAPIAGIYNLAVVLKDAIFENQTPDMFKEVFKPKVNTTIFLDKLSRSMCPQLKYFVVFSSVSCGLGNAGQTNYGMANSVMERICEQRKKNGLPALAIQWGAIGEVGIVADMLEEDKEMEIGGTLQQKVSSCINVLEQFMMQPQNAILSSMVVAEKKLGESSNQSILGAIANILNIKDLKKISPQMAISELGMDSITAVEIKQCFERDFEIFLTPSEIKTLTIAKIQELSEQHKRTSTVEEKEQKPSGLDLILKNVGDEMSSSDPVKHMITVAGKYANDKDPSLFILPGIEGNFEIFVSMCKRLKYKAMVFQYGYRNPNETILELAQRLELLIRPQLTVNKKFVLLGYSLGSLVAVELTKLLEAQGYSGVVVLVDGSPDYIPELIRVTSVTMSEDIFQNTMITHLFKIIGYSVSREILADILECKTWNDKLKMIEKSVIFPIKYPMQYIIRLIDSIYRRVEMVKPYKPTAGKIKAQLLLLRTKEVYQGVLIDEDYGLSKYVEQPIKMHLLDGTHVTILENKDCPNIINKYLQEISLVE